METDNQQQITSSLRGYKVIIIIIILFYPRYLFPRRFKNWWKWLKGYDAQSEQSGTGRLSCSRTALKRCTSTETRWYKWLVSLVSPEIEEILLNAPPIRPRLMALYKCALIDWLIDWLIANWLLLLLLLFFFVTPNGSTYISYIVIKYKIIIKPAK